ncbi:MAG: trigger factor [Pirellulaceae bacterium]
MNTELENDTTTAEADKPKLSLNVKVDETSPCERHVTVSIPRDDIERYFSEKFDELAPQAEVPGFRTGKAPRKLVENRFRDQIEDQVKGSLLMDSLAQISDDQDFSAISEPDFDFESIEIPDDGPMTYEFNIEVRPEFEMPNWKGMKLKRTEHEFTDEEVDSEIERIGSRSSDLIPVDEAAKPGDWLVLNIVATHDDNEVASATEQLVELRKNLSFGDAILNDFDKLMKGASAGDSKSTKVEVSEFATNEDLQGKEIDLELTVLDVKRMDSRPAEEIIEMLGFDSVDKLREVVRENLNNQLQYSQRQEVRQQINELLTESATWELPQDLLKRQSRREMDRALIELRSSGFSEDQILAQENQLRQNVLSRTETTLKEHFILERIAEIEGVEDEDADYELEIAKIAMQRNDSPRRVRARLERTGQMDALRNMIVEQKVIGMIEEHAEFKSVKRKNEKSDETAAIDFFVSGIRGGDEIPEAKYDDGGAEQTLPNTVTERD